MTHSPMELTVQRETQTEARKTVLTCCEAVGGGTPCGSEMKTDISGWAGEGPQAIGKACRRGWGQQGGDRGVVGAGASVLSSGCGFSS